MNYAGRRAIAWLSQCLLLPAELFFAALAVRTLGSSGGDVAQSAGLIVRWYAERPGVGLGLFLILLPLAALAAGLSALAGRMRTGSSTPPRDRLTTVATEATLAAALILTIVGLHVLAT